MVRNFIFCLFLILLSCDPNEVKPIDPVDEDGDDLELAFELILEGSNFEDICGITQIDSSENSYHLYFEKNACPGSITRDGEIELTLIEGNNWNEKNAVMEITYLNYTVEKLGQEPGGVKKMFYKRTLTGSERIINVSGGIMDDFLNDKINSLKRMTRGENLSIRYNTGTNAYRYNEASMREIQKEGDIVTIISSGDTTINEYTNVQEWGVDIDNQRFYKVITEPIVKTLCGDRWIFTQGKKVSYNTDQVRRKIYGVNQNGEADNSCSTYGFKVILEGPEGQISETVYKY